mmetsp:Transcript_7211/g.12941  ORF Transcript_7211/g.12941 Transcript_7211/m.12941 type:complete len:277 (-) Transcript_7211:123-953(-)|eukprot:CAMPEP_0198298396 /NCGR_PEP_ID=MMETSP1449-20131203/40845_1 /TAXON_ID=420275 /ORGANISM="Attheya septentrionalis, Strain CCMP2084" /LENGTH=276 /DNA_ID=CAMNT_0043999653 /DNA_START=136 /DNA_END=966 /DNA_ORIENTATION=+
MRVLVTGGNQGIGFALCKQLAIEKNCHVYLTARTPEKGIAAVSEINDIISKTPSCSGSVEFIPLDTSSDESVAAAAQEARSKLAGKEKLYGIVNNAGIGLNTGNTGDLLNTNLYGPKRVCEQFLDLLDEKNGRIVNLGSGAGPNHVSGCSLEDKKVLCSPDTVTWEYIEKHAKENLHGSNAYGLSKSLLACYTGLFAREHPNILTSCVTPGFIQTQMTDGYGASKTPEEGTLPIKHCLFEELAGNGLYYGSDAVRSPYHFMRSPGEPAYDGVNPFL